MSKRIAWNVPFDQEFNIGDITWVRSDGLWGLGAQSVNNINNNNTKNVKIIKFMYSEQIQTKLTLYYYDIEYV